MPSTPRSTRREALEPTAQRRVVGDAGGVPRLVEEALVQPAADCPASAFATPSDRTKASKSSRQQAPSGRLAPVERAISTPESGPSSRGTG